ncbi:hypothetical protein AALP_AAs43157U000100, partial [Arabis alpina]
MQPDEFYFEPTEYNAKCKIQTKCDVKGFLAILKETGMEPELKWFEDHPQFGHILHMVEEPNHRVQGLWMLLLRTVKVDRDNVVWFVVNGVPIRYSLREHALLCGFNCEDYPVGMNPSKTSGKYKSKLKMKVFGEKKKVCIKDVRDELMSMIDEETSKKRLKLTILLFLCSVIASKPNVEGNIDLFLWKMAENPDLCITFPWGRLTFENTVKVLYHGLELMNGSAKKSFCAPAFAIPLEILAFEAIPILKKSCRVVVDKLIPTCPRMCKTKFSLYGKKGWSMKELYGKLGDTQDIESILVTEYEEEEELLSHIFYPTYDGFDIMLDGWINHLEAKKKICWKELFDVDVASRNSNKQGTLPVEKLDPKKNPALLQYLKTFEDSLRQEFREEYATKEELKKKNKKLRTRVKLLRGKVRFLRSEVKSLRSYDYGGYGYEYEAEETEK